MPLSSSRDMSVSISSWCLWRCAHKGKGEAIEFCHFFVHHSISPFVYPRLLISGGWGVGGLVHPYFVEKKSKGRLTRSPCSPPPPPSPCRPPRVPVCGAAVHISDVRWCSSHNISSSPASVAAEPGPTNRSHIWYAPSTLFVFSERSALKFCLTLLMSWSQPENSLKSPCRRLPLRRLCSVWAGTFTGCDWVIALILAWIRMWSQICTFRTWIFEYLQIHLWGGHPFFRF